MPQSPPSGGYKLTYEVNGEHREYQMVGDRVRIGRAEDCDLIMPKGGVSRRHAILTLENGEWYLADNGSTNGTFCNGVRITKERLRDSDLFELGSVKFKFHNLRPVGPVTPTAEDAVEFEGVQSVKGSIFMDELESPSGRLADMVREKPQPIDQDAPFGQRAPLGRPAAQELPIGQSLGEMQIQKMMKMPLDAAEYEPSMIGGAENKDWQARGLGKGVEIFAQVGEALLSTADLTGTLESILSLAFKNVPAQRGVICLYDEKTTRVTPTVFRSPDKDPKKKIRISRTVISSALQSKQAVLVSDAGSDSRFSEAASVISLAINSVMCAPLICKGKVLGLIYVDTKSRVKPFDEPHLEILTALALFSAVALEQARLKEEVAKEQRIRAKLSRYHSPSVVDQICASAAQGTAAEEMLAEEREVTVLFADLSGFTAASEKLTPPDVVKMLNRLFGKLATAVFDYRGTLDKFMGDGMLAFFGAPIDAADHQERAVRAALMMQQSVALLNADMPPDRHVRVRIGMNSGPAVVGEMGSPERHDYTVIGDTVNLASRLESSVAKPGQIVLGPTLGEAVKHVVSLERLPPVKLKGKELPVEPWLVLGLRDIKNTESSPGHALQ